MSGLLDLASKWSNIYSAIKLHEIQDDQKKDLEKERNEKALEEWDKDPLNLWLKEQVEKDKAEQEALYNFIGYLLDIRREARENPKSAKKMMTILINEIWTSSDESNLIMILDRIIRQEFIELNSLFIECFANKILPTENLDLEKINKEIQEFEKLVQSQLDTFLGLITNSISIWRHFQSDVPTWPKDFNEQINKSIESLSPPPQIYSELIFNLKNNHLLKKNPNIIPIIDNELERLKSQLIKAKTKFQEFRKIQTEKEMEVKRILDDNQKTQKGKSNEIERKIEIEDKGYRNYKDNRFWLTISGFVLGVVSWHYFVWYIFAIGREEATGIEGAFQIIIEIVFAFLLGGEVTGVILAFLFYKLFSLLYSHEFGQREKIEDEVWYGER